MWLQLYLVLELECDQPLLEVLAQAHYWATVDRSVQQCVDYLDGVERIKGPHAHIFPSSDHKFPWHQYQDINVVQGLMRRNGMALQFVEHPTFEICRLALQSTPNAFKFIQKNSVLSEAQYVALCYLAVQQRPSALVCMWYPIPCSLFLNEYPGICRAAVQGSGWALECVVEEALAHQTYVELCLEAVTGDSTVLQHLKERHDILSEHPEISLAAVRQNGLMLQYVPNPTVEMCQIAIQQHPAAQQYVPHSIVLP